MSPIYFSLISERVVGIEYKLSRGASNKTVRQPFQSVCNAKKRFIRSSVYRLRGDTVPFERISIETLRLGTSYRDPTPLSGSR